MIHQYKSNGYNIVMDVNSGSVHVVDDIVYDFINYAIEMKLEGNNISLEEIYKMYKNQIKLIHKNRNA